MVSVSPPPRREDYKTKKEYKKAKKAIIAALSVHKSILGKITFLLCKNFLAKFLRLTNFLMKSFSKQKRVI